MDSKGSHSFSAGSPKNAEKKAVRQGVEIVVNGSDGEDEGTGRVKLNTKVIKPIMIEENPAGKSRPQSSQLNRPKSRVGENTPAPGDQSALKDRPFSGITNKSKNLLAANRDRDGLLSPSRAGSSQAARKSQAKSSKASMDLPLIQQWCENYWN